MQHAFRSLVTLFAEKRLCDQALQAWLCETPMMSMKLGPFDESCQAAESKIHTVHDIATQTAQSSFPSRAQSSFQSPAVGTADVECQTSFSDPSVRRTPVMRACLGMTSLPCSRPLKKASANCKRKTRRKFVNSLLHMIRHPLARLKKTIEKNPKSTRSWQAFK